MLTELRIRHFALLDTVKVSFPSGESVVTGETGSGKSLFVDALDFLRGARADKRVLHGDETAVVEGCFTWSEEESATEAALREHFEELGIPLEDRLLIARREISPKGSRQRLNDVTVTLQSYRLVMEILLDIHAQNAQSLLKSPRTYLPLLDSFIGAQAEKEKSDLRDVLLKQRHVQEQLDRLALSPDEVLRERDLLRYQIQEIDSADLPNLDEEELEREYKALVSATERLQLANRLYGGISGDRGLRDALLSCAQTFDQLSHKDEGTSFLRDRMWQMEADMEALQEDLENYRNTIVIDPQRIEEVDQIFQLLQMLRRKYGQQNEAILAFRDQAAHRLELLNHIEQERKTLQEKQAALTRQLQEKADALHVLRVNAAEKLEKRVKEELLEMAIRQIAFTIPITKTQTIGANGQDVVDFQISTNPGEPMLSLSDVASGGEMSRFMLALKIIASEITAMPTLVFDEIDTGISGRTAQVVAEKLSRLTDRHQVIVITHLPQIAALADAHYAMTKETRKNETMSFLSELDSAGRIAEQARLLGGVQITEVTRKGAKEMIEQARQWKRERKGWS
ncbi:DNA repair protein RecN [Murdochiella vaginalis]|uniref:DNA repair protein RecN n=1 Tax=Murdochiella vaginalis TaxID=1852373 RepID=UPI0008FDAB66|nr:DNA repair protein RecN [Murdochiella vaginalis]